MTYEELEQSLDKYGTYHYKDVLEAHEIGEYNAIDRVLEIIDDVEHIEGLSKADEYGLLRMRVKELNGEQDERI